MSNETRDRTEGRLTEAGGKAKEGLGDLRGDESQKAEGRGDQAEGKGKQAKADVKEGISNAKDKAGDAWDKVSGN